MAKYKTIFLADDDSEDQEIFADALRLIDPDIHCFCAKDGEQALQLLAGDFLELPDLIFLDLNMPKVNGRQVLSKLKETETLRHVPIVMYSTFFSDEDINEFEELGIRYLIKPSAFDQLVASLTTILKEK